MKIEAFVLPQTRKCANCSLGFSNTEVTKCVICLPYKILSQFFFFETMLHLVFVVGIWGLILVFFTSGSVDCT